MDINFAEYINEACLILIPVLYLIGMWLKRGKFLKNKYIPLALGGAGIVLAILQLGFTSGFGAEILLSGFIQGILVAGAAVLGNQIIKQAKKVE